MTAEKKDLRPLHIKNLADLKRHIRLGTELVATAHQYHPDIVGLTRVVTKVQTNGFYSKIKDQPDHKWSTCNHGMGFWSPFSKASAYHFTDSTVQVLNTRKNDGSVLYEMELYDSEPSISEQNKEVTDMNEWDRLHRQAQRYKEAFMISLIIQQLYREILAVADENGGQLKNRCVFFCDEFGTLPKIESAEMMFSASRSRRLQIVPIIQSFAQLEKNYGKEGGEIIVDNTQITLFGGFAPNSSSADTLSKALGSRTVMSGSVSRSKNDPSESLQMMERPLLTPDELKSLPKGDFVVMKTGVHPMRVHLKLFFKWGIEFDKDHPYTVAENGNRKVQYANKAELMDGIVRKYHPEALLEGDVTAGGSEMEEPKQTEAKNHQPPKSNRSRSRQPKPLPDQTEKDGKKGGSQPSHKQVTVEPEPEPVPMEASDGQT